MILRILRLLRVKHYPKMSGTEGYLHCDSSGPNTFVEGAVCKENDLKDNEMKVYELGDNGGRVLLVKQNGQFSAVGTRCAHYGAPLVGGALGEGRVRCPWHGACFSLSTGDIEDFPGLNSIPCYKVQVDTSGNVIVRAKKMDLEANVRLKDMAARDPMNKNTFVIIGGGAAGQCCIETLRQEGFTGRIVMVTEDQFLPYDRIKLSKQADATVDKIQLRPDAFYKEHGIEVMTNSKVVSLDTKEKRVNLENGTFLNYNALFIATGSQPRKVNLPGADLENIFTLRSLADASAIHKALNSESDVVVYGSSFIGMEIAAYCSSRVKSVTVVGRSKVPFKQSLGVAVGERIRRVFTDREIGMELGSTLKEFVGTDGKVKSVILSDDRTIPASVVIVGLGSTPATGFLDESGIGLTNDNFIKVNQFLETNKIGVFAGGDVAFAPVAAFNNLPAAIGHWQLAHYHGRIAALNMLAKAKPLNTVPFFWTVLFGNSYRYAGYASCYDDVLIGGSLDELKFAAYYCVGDNVIAVCTVGTDPIAAYFAETISSGKKLTKSFINNNLLDWYKKPIPK